MKKKGFTIDFIGIGAPRSGTTWLASCLGEHPQICFSNEKEINFFNKKLFWVKNWQWQYPLGLDWYKQHFSHCHPGQIKGEFSVSYLYDNRAPRLIHKHFPGVKLIIVLRNPIELLYSFYQFHKYEFSFPDFSEIIKNPEFIAYGRYVQNIKRYLDYFPRNRMIILLHDDIKKDPLALTRKVYEFLRVDSTFIPSSLYQKVNTAGEKLIVEAACYYGLRNRVRKSIGVHFNKLPKLKKFLVAIDIRLCAAIRNAGRSSRTYRNMPPHVKKELIEIYEPEIKRLEKFINRRLDIWRL